jgi:hypothetical protein
MIRARILHIEHDEKTAGLSRIGVMHYE